MFCYWPYKHTQAYVAAVIVLAMASFDSSVLDKHCSSAHITKISEHIENWQELAPYFGLTEAEEQDIRVDHAHQYKVQKHKMVWKWVRKQGDRATYRELKRVFEEAEESLLFFFFFFLYNSLVTQTRSIQIAKG